jgi:hypothetical protein
MKKIYFLVYFSISLFGLWAQQFSISAGAELLESTEFKNNGIPYIIERRYKLRSGEILYAYYDVEGSNSVTIQKIEQTPILSIGTDVNIPGMPGYREFNFGADNKKLVQFMKLLKLGAKSFKGGAKIPSLSDRIFTLQPPFTNEFKLVLDLYDETWVLEHRTYSGNTTYSTENTEIIHVKEYEK